MPRVPDVEAHAAGHRGGSHRLDAHLRVVVERQRGEGAEQTGWRDHELAVARSHDDVHAGAHTEHARGPAQHELAAASSHRRERSDDRQRRTQVLELEPCDSLHLVTALAEADVAERQQTGVDDTDRDVQLADPTRLVQQALQLIGLQR